MTDLYSEILKYKQMAFNREELIQDYAQQILESMDMKTMETFVYDTLVSNLDDYSDEQLVEEVNEHYPELLNSNNL